MTTNSTAPAKHTPGPWKAEVVGVHDLGNPTDICEITNGYARIAEYVSDKDAALIAAAPDLLAACKEVLLFVPVEDERIHKLIYAAIARAEGK